MSADVERVARALCALGGFDPDEIMANDGPRWRYYADSADAAMRETRLIDAEALRDAGEKTEMDTTTVACFLAGVSYSADWLTTRAGGNHDGCCRTAIVCYENRAGNAAGNSARP